MKKIISLTLAALMLMATLTGCKGSSNAAGSTADGESVYTFKMANEAPPGDPNDTAFNHFKDILEERSNGRIKATYYGNKTMGSSNLEQVEMTMSGALQFTTCPGFTFTSLDSSLKAFNVTDYPFLFQSDEESFRFFDSELGTQMRAEAEGKLDTIKIYPAFNMGWFSLYTAKNAIKVPADIAGQKLRVSANDLYVRMMKAWGASAIPIAWQEVYTALQQKVCDGLATPAELFNLQKFYEVQDYMCVLNYGALSHYPVVNKEFYESLPEDLQKVFDECILEYVSSVREGYIAGQAAAVDATKAAGVEVYVPTEADMKLWMDPIIPLWDELGDFAGAEIVTQVREMNGR